MEQRSRDPLAIIVPEPCRRQPVILDQQTLQRGEITGADGGDDGHRDGILGTDRDHRPTSTRRRYAAARPSGSIPRIRPRYCGDLPARASPTMPTTRYWSRAENPLRSIRRRRHVLQVLLVAVEDGGTIDHIAIGNYGQFIYVAPANRTIIVRTGQSWRPFGATNWLTLLRSIAHSD